MRAFIAIDLNPEIKKTLYELIKELDKETKSVKWVSEGGMHLTLKFLGEIDKDRVQEVENVLKKVSSQYRPFSMKLKGTGSFPPGKKVPRVLWIGIEAEETLKALQAHLEGELEKLGFPREERKFHPHLTLGRVKIPTGLGQALALLDKYQERNFGEMKVEKVVFLQSILKPTGAEYSVLSEFKLS